MTADSEILAPSCRIIDLVILNPKKYRSLRVFKNIDSFGYKQTGYAAGGEKELHNAVSYRESKEYKDYKEYKPPSVDLKDFKSGEKEFKEYNKDFKQVNDYKDYTKSPPNEFKDSYKPTNDYKEYSKDYNKDYTKPSAGGSAGKDFTDYSYPKKDNAYSYDKDRKTDNLESTDDLVVKSDEPSYQKYNSYDKYQKDSTGASASATTTPLAFNYKKPDINYSYSNNTTSLEQGGNNNFISITDNLNIDRTSSENRLKTPSNYTANQTGNSSQPFNYTERMSNEFSNNRQRFASEKRGYSRETKPEDASNNKYGGRGGFNPDTIMSERGGNTQQEKSVGYGKPAEKRVIFYITF
jgi:hypothetical protein